MSGPRQRAAIVISARNSGWHCVDQMLCGMHYSGCLAGAWASLLGPVLKARSAMKIETAHDYVDENGELLYQNVRVEEPDKGKTFYYRRPDGNGGWVYDLDGLRKVPYRFPQVLVAIAKGE